MADGDLTPADFGVAFTFARSEAGNFTDAGGILQLAPIDVPRFDHADDGTPRGLLVTPGSDLGRQDRTAIDPLMLPLDLVAGTDPAAREATVFHCFRPEPTPEAADAFDAGIQRRALYSRDAARTIDALLRQPGHHLAIGVVAGFRPNLGGFTRFRGQQWILTGKLAAVGGVLGDGSSVEGRALITCGAEVIDG
ncbi:MAG: hypothetical protein IE933_03520 [Sphingomonadales bacterium]|nr:hypothetical protein [Sphingomonadales bacterium]MBD3772112.1 hypothetical protein [Paracoccaceae bacterium]